jgi:diguanylate cyclase (GGDEF)-like protein
VKDSGAWAALLNGLPYAAWVVELATVRVVAANAEAAALLGRTAQTLIGERADHLVASPEDMAWWDAGGADGLLHSESWVVTAEGRTLRVSRSIGLIDPGESARATHALVVLVDRSAEQVAETERETLVAELRATLEATADGILVTDLDGRLRAFNRRLSEVWALPSQILQARDDAAVEAWMAHRVVDRAAYEERLASLRATPEDSSSERVELLTGQIIERVSQPLVFGGRAQGRVWSFRDLTQRLQAEERIEALTLNDGLTGLPNRRRLGECVAQAVADARREGTSFGFLFIDLDRFRQINDSLGHDVGDRVLMDIAQRIQGCLRQDDTLARLGGDQFAVIVSRADAPAAESTARRVLNVVAQPCHVDGAPFTLTCSIGVAIAPAQGSRIDDLVRHAEAAMRAVKSAGRANYRLHQSRAEGDRRQHMRLDHAMRQALVSGRFRLLYQPQVNLVTGSVVGAEALLRWRDPELGDLSPAQFIPVAEESGFIVAIGDWVLGQAVRQIVLWQQRGVALPIAVNVSALQFQQTHFVDRVASVLAVSGVPPHLLELELTESILLHDADEALHRLRALARLGVRMSIDDFGTGYSSLAYLKRLPIGKLKIDRSFIAGLPDDISDAGIVRAILQVAHALGMQAIAEGVETESQRAFLQAAGCDEFQGFLFAPALDSLSFERRLGVAETRPPAPRMRLVRQK